MGRKLQSRPEVRDQARSRSPRAAHADYDVGYCSPPKHTRFKPGRSGNPKGRPKGRRNLRTVLDEVLNKPVTIREGQRTRKVPQIEALGHRLMSGALSGDPKAVMSILALLRFAGTGPEPEHAYDGLTEQDDEAIIADYLRRVAAGAANPIAEPDLRSAVPSTANGTRKGD